MISKSVRRFSGKIMRKQTAKRDDDLKKSHPALRRRHAQSGRRRSLMAARRCTIALAGSLSGPITVKWLAPGTIS